MPHRRHFLPAAQPYRSWGPRLSAWGRPRIAAPVYVPWQAPLRSTAQWDAWMRPYWDGRFIDFWRDRIAAALPMHLRRPAAIEGMLRSWSGPAAFVQSMLGPIQGGAPALPTLAQLLGLSWTSMLTRQIAEVAGSRFSSTQGYLSAPIPGSNWAPGGLPTSPGAHPGAKKQSQASKAVLDAALAVVSGLGGIDYEAARDYLEQYVEAEGTREDPTIPTDPAACVQTVLGLLQSDPQLYADVLKNAGSEAAVIARLETTCGVLSAQCGGMQPQACMNKLCPGVTTPEQCYEQVFATETGEDKSNKSSAAGWIIGLGALAVGAGVLYAAMGSKYKDNPTEHMFGVTRRRITAATGKKLDRIAKRHGARFVGPVNIPGSDVRGWFTGPNLGHPFDTRLAQAVLADVAAEGIALALG